MTHLLPSCIPHSNRIPTSLIEYLPKYFLAYVLPVPNPATWKNCWELNRKQTLPSASISQCSSVFFLFLFLFFLPSFFLSSSSSVCTSSLDFSWKRTYIQFSSVAQSCLTLYNPMNHSTPGLPVHHQLPEFTQTHVHQIGDGIQPSLPLSSPSPAPNPSQHQGFFQWVNSSHEVAKVLEIQLQHQSFQWTPRTDLL